MLILCLCSSPSAQPLPPNSPPPVPLSPRCYTSSSSRALCGMAYSCCMMHCGCKSCTLIWFLPQPNSAAVASQLSAFRPTAFQVLYQLRLRSFCVG